MSIITATERIYDTRLQTVSSSGMRMLELVSVQSGLGTLEGGVRWLPYWHAFMDV